MSESGLSDGSLKVRQAVKQAIKGNYPDLSESEVERAGEFLLKELANHIEKGEKIAFVQPTDNGSMKLIVLDLEILKKGS